MGLLSLSSATVPLKLSLSKTFGRQWCGCSRLNKFRMNAPEMFGAKTKKKKVSMIWHHPGRNRVQLH